MKLLIAGSRTITNMNVLLKAINSFNLPFHESKISLVLSGTANGVDKLGEVWARCHHISIKQFPADWDKHGKAAGFIRNKEMVKETDVLFLIWDGKSKGSASTKKLAEQKGIPIYEYIVRE